MRTDLTAKAKELEDFRAQAAVTRQAAPAEAAEMEKLRAEHKALLDRIAVVDLQNHPDFKRQYVTPRQEAIKAAKEVLDYNGQEGVELDGLLSLPLKAFNAKVAEATKDLNSMDATTVQTSLRLAYTLNNAGKQALSQAGELGQQLVQADAAKAKGVFEKIWEKIDVAKDVLVPVDAPDDATPEEKQSFEARNQALTQLRANATPSAASTTRARRSSPPRPPCRTSSSATRCPASPPPTTGWQRARWRRRPSWRRSSSPAVPGRSRLLLRQERSREQRRPRRRSGLRHLDVSGSRGFLSTTAGSLVGMGQPDCSWSLSSVGG